MTGDTVTGQAVHHVLVREDRAVGMSIVNSSMDASSNAGPLKAWWGEQLAPHYRLKDGTGTPPKEAFTFTHLEDGQAAVLRRLAGGSGIGRNFCHAVVGPVAVLDDIALPTTLWRGWLQPEDSNAVLKASDPVKFTERVAGNRTKLLRRSADIPREHLIGLLGLACRYPRQALDVAGIDTELVPAALQAVKELATAVGRRPRPWTYSSFEDGFVPHRSLQFVFLRRLPDKMAGGSGDRVVADLGGDLPMSAEHRQAAAWLYGSLREIWHSGSTDQHRRARDWEELRAEIGKHTGRADEFSDRFAQFASRRLHLALSPASSSAAAEPTEEEDEDEAQGGVQGTLPDPADHLVLETDEPEDVTVERDPRPAIAAVVHEPLSRPRQGLPSAPPTYDIVAEQAAPAAMTVTPDPLWQRIMNARNAMELAAAFPGNNRVSLSVDERWWIWHKWQGGRLDEILRDLPQSEKENCFTAILDLLLGSADERATQDEIARGLTEWLGKGNQAIYVDKTAARRRTARQRPPQTRLGRLHALLNDVGPVLKITWSVLVLAIVLVTMGLLIGLGTMAVVLWP
ncbi:hypothetical protein [Amycolatopsis azurea]|uniref:Uncharacterized protein n=1 Tax=Amycolatopsis azurea DSM 43854 TaxID=1238180 RepID=M2QEY7_9PSEU|nr:hypothetical protein [Amycolatopsis azurea]EMD25306.1 hypothetical protein C791_4915 [Amycolatopsis azurea DSM 43854]OOC02281.1 hypothetical protein B0293_33140 [Amycolatopsis azurea DSM 43854]